MTSIRDIHYVLTATTTAPRSTASPTSPACHWADEQAGFLAGVAAATTTQTGIVGFLGAFNAGGQEDTRAGFEAGAQSIDPDIEVLAAYMADFGYRDAAYDSPEGCSIRRQSALRGAEPT